MIQNIKVDAIYYLTNSDFEMEFNLCGCCKMRLLTDKAENPKNLVGLLSRAVSRSQVIICCGKLFDNDGLIKIVSQAIKRPLCTVNNSDFGIMDESEINIIDGSLPLVNSDGCFCGCIIESGPQSIILLTDNKSIRKTVMKQLIHPYIEELSIARNTNDTKAEETNASDLEEAEIVTEPETILENDSLEETVDAENLPQNDETLLDSEQTEIVDEVTSDESADNDTTDEVIEASDDELIENQPDEQTEEPESNEDEETDTSNTEDTSADITLPEVIMDEEIVDEPEIFMDPAEINSGFELYLEPERVKYSKKSHYELNYVPSERDNDFISESSDIEYFEEPKNKFMSLPILIISIVLLVALAALVYLLVLVPMSSDYTFSEYVRDIFSVSINLPFRLI
ncbi:MAG: hypothetical protein E7561_01025 [Ruminococcaceae bacterium]|nr:hypothetical protein [Oscillospiraceae bacterium]